MDSVRGIFLDIETNGLDCDIHRSLEICVNIYDLHNMLCIGEYSSMIHCSEFEWDNECDSKALEINGITYKDVEHAKMHREVCEDLVELFLSLEIDKTNSVFICQNPSFDRGFFNHIIPIEIQKELDLPYHWLDVASMYFIKNLVPQKINGRTVTYHPNIRLIPCSKDAIASFYGLPIEGKPHRATNGVHHLIECYKAILYN